jgi:hypothetical protein
MCMLSWKQILGISIYIESGGVDQVPFGKRPIVYSSSADLGTIFREERQGKYIKKVQEETGEQGKMLVMGEILYLTPLSIC